MTEVRNDGRREVAAPSEGDSATLLDNVAWHSIATRHAGLADRVGNAGRYHREVAPFSGVADLDSWNDLAAVVGVGKPAIIFAPKIEVADGWTIDNTFVCLQFVADGVPDAETDDEIVVLGPADVPEMIELVNATRPGPFSARTINMGSYYGIRRSGRLVAMSGERMGVPGYTEVSAVCTADDVRGQGLGRKVVDATIAGIRARGDEAFLHVVADNTPAIKLYEAMGLEVRCEAQVAFVKKDGD